MAQALYRKWRPHHWNEVIGQDHVIQTLRNAVGGDRVAHAYLFAGPRGTGKTTTARLLAKAVNCLSPDPGNRPCDQCEHCKAVNDSRFLDLIEIDAASNTSVDDVRDLRDKINFSPSQGAFKVYIIDEVHMLSTAAFNALLKTLEEPPSHAIFILATTEVHKIPATVLSRCQRHEFRRVPVKEIIAVLDDIAAKENIRIQPEAMTLIARQATGSFRDAISLLDQLSSFGGEITLDQAQIILGTATSQVVIDLVDSLTARQAGKGFDLIQQALDAGSDPRQFARQVVDYLRNLLLMQMGNADQVDATLEIRNVMALQAQAFDSSWLLETIRAFTSAAADQQRGWQPGLALELALAQSVEGADVSSRNALANNIGSASQPASPKPSGQPIHPPDQPRSGSENSTGVDDLSQPAQLASSDQFHSKPKNLEQQPSRTIEKATPAATSQPPPSPATPPQDSQPVTTQNPSATSFQSINQNWQKIRSLVKKNKRQTEALLNSCKPLGIKDGVLLLGFVNELLKSKMETNDNLLIIRQALNQVLEIDIQVRCVISGKSAKSLPADLNVETDGMVGTALRDLGGEVVDVQ